MSQVLEKPILLDETGQDISSKINGVSGKLDTNGAAIVNALDDIKDAIGTSSEFIPVMIKVVTPPTKTLYKVGEHLDLSGMVVNLIGTNGVNIDVTQACTFVPANGAALTSADTSVAITYHYAAGNLDFSASQALTIRALDSIAVTTPPIKTAYQTGETLDLTGIVVTATYSDGYTTNVTPDCIFSPANGTVLVSGDNSVSVSYTDGGITKNTTTAIGVKELLSIAVTHIPTKTKYRIGETLDLTGIVVTATYDDTSTLDVTNHCVFSPANGATLTASDTSVSISYTEGATTKTTSQTIIMVVLDSIAVTTPPTKTTYVAGDTLDLTGIVVTATYTDATTADVTSSCIFNPANGATLTSSNSSVSISYTEGSITKTTSQAIVVVEIYGVQWDGTASPVLTRTDAAANFTEPVPYAPEMSGEPSSPFDTIQPWAGMQIVEDTNAGSLVSIPKFWYKLSKASGNLKIQIANRALDGFSVSPAHMDRGDGHGERDVVYVGRYHCSSNYKSETGVVPRVNITRAAFRSGIHNLGADIWQSDYAMRFTIQLLYIVEFANWDSQETIGRGCGNGSAMGNMGDSDSMVYHTGRMYNKNLGSGFGLGTQYRHIEGLWENAQDFIDGCWYDRNNTKLKIILNPANFSDSSGGIAANTTPVSCNKVVKAFGVDETSGLFPLLIPSENASGMMNNHNYVTDSVSFINAMLAGGGGYSQGYTYGLFYQYSQDASTTDGQIGSRLMKLPNS